MFSGVFNIIGAFMFITPRFYESYLLFFNTLNPAIGLSGNSISIPQDIFHALFINTAGIDLVLIGVIVLFTARILRAIPLHKIISRLVGVFLL